MSRIESLPDPAAVQEPEYQHSVTRWASADEFHAAAAHEDGIHIIGSEPARQLEILTGGRPFERADGPVLVIFSGAVGDRASKVPPFFSGSGLGAATGHPFIAVSDPSLELAQTLSIAWYAGNAGHDTPRVIVDLLAPLARRLGTGLWLIGGSAGGFAALTIGHALPGAPTVLTWNPQTDILDYSRRFVVDYVRAAFPADRKALGGPAYKDAARAAFQRLGRSHSVRETLPGQGPGRLFYLQNATDSHLRDHCLPYLRANGYTRYGHGIWRRDREHVIWIADVAPGHTPPSRDQLITLLNIFTNSDADILSTVRDLDSAGHFRDDPERRPEPLSRAAREVEDRIAISWDGGSIHVESEQLPAGFGGITWRAAHIVEGEQIEQSETMAAWGQWAPASGDRGGRVDVALTDGFGDPILTRSVVL